MSHDLLLPAHNLTQAVVLYNTHVPCIPVSPGHYTLQFSLPVVGGSLPTSQSRLCEVMSPITHHVANDVDNSSIMCLTSPGWHDIS